MVKATAYTTILATSTRSIAQEYLTNCTFVYALSASAINTKNIIKYIAEFNIESMQLNIMGGTSFFLLFPTSSIIDCNTFTLYTPPYTPSTYLHTHLLAPSNAYAFLSPQFFPVQTHKSDLHF